MINHADAIHALTQRIDLLFYLRRTHDDPAEARRQIRSLISSVRRLRSDAVSWTLEVVTR